MQKVIFVILLIAASFLLAVGLAKTGMVKPSKPEIEPPKEEYTPHWSCKPDSGEYGVRLYRYNEEKHTYWAYVNDDCIAVGRETFLEACEYSKQFEERGFFVYFNATCWVSFRSKGDKTVRACAIAVKWPEHQAIGTLK